MSGYFCISSACLRLSAVLGEHEFVRELAGVLEDEADLLAALHLDPVRHVFHLAVALAHDDLDSRARAFSDCRARRPRSALMRIDVAQRSR